MYKVLTAVCFVIGCQSVSAEVIVEESGSKAIFKVSGAQVTPVQAQEAARSPNARVERCTPIKGAVSASGGEVGAYKCKFVVLVINPKTGTTKWKNL